MNTEDKNVRASQELLRFRWRYKGRSPEGATCSFEGSGKAPDKDTAFRELEKSMRKRWPTMKWMHGREIEGNGVTFGPTIKFLKGKKL